jgi:hypothetical protein
VCTGNPLKNVGFQTYKGATPHFKKTHVNKINQETPIVIISFIVEAATKKLNTCSIRNQSRVRSLVYNSRMNKNKFNEETKDIQKKYRSDCR